MKLEGDAQIIFLPVQEESMGLIVTARSRAVLRSDLINVLSVLFINSRGGRGTCGGEVLHFPLLLMGAMS
jgi:hypothetical protein